MNKILKMNEVQNNIDDIKMNLAEANDKELSKSFYTLLKLQENPDFILVSSNIEKINELADDESFYFLNAYVRDLSDSSLEFYESINMCLSSAITKQYVEENIIYLGHNYGIKNGRITNTELIDFLKSKEEEYKSILLSKADNQRKKEYIEEIYKWNKKNVFVNYNEYLIGKDDDAFDPAMVQSVLTNRKNMIGKNRYLLQAFIINDGQYRFALSDENEIIDDTFTDILYATFNHHVKELGKFCATYLINEAYVIGTSTGQKYMSVGKKSEYENEVYSPIYNLKI